MQKPDKVRKTSSVTYEVHAGSGHCGPKKFDDYEAARAFAIEEAAVPSYMGPGRRHSQLVKKHTFTTVEDYW